MEGHSPAIRLICSKVIFFFHGKFVAGNESILMPASLCQQPNSPRQGGMSPGIDNNSDGTGQELLPSPPSQTPSLGQTETMPQIDCQGRYFAGIMQFLPLNSMTAKLDYLFWHLFICTKGTCFPPFIFILPGSWHPMMQSVVTQSFCFD